METQEITFRIQLKLSEAEALAVSRLAQAECRDLKEQAYYLLRCKLADLGMLPTVKPEAVSSIQRAKA
jgi:hypothetical protein